MTSRQPISRLGFRPRPEQPRSVGLRRGLLGLALVASLGLAWPVPASAAERYTPARKLGRAAANLTLGVVALPGQITQTVRESGPFVGATWGLTKGVVALAVTEVIGVFELITCPFATPPGYKPIIRPEFPWQYFAGDPPSEFRRD